MANQNPFNNHNSRPVVFSIDQTINNASVPANANPHPNLNTNVNVNSNANSNQNSNTNTQASTTGFIDGPFMGFDSFAASNFSPSIFAFSNFDASNFAASNKVAKNAKPKTNFMEDIIEAANRDEKTLRDLITRENLDINKFEDEGLFGSKTNPLIKSLKEGKFKIAERLIRAGADVNVATPANETPLYWWAYTARNDKNNEELKLILEEGGTKTINAQDKTQTQNTALHWAILNGNYSGAILLLKNGADPNIMGSQGRTALHNAISMIYNTPERFHELLISLIRCILAHGGKKSINEYDESGSYNYDETLDSTAIGNLWINPNPKIAEDASVQKLKFKILKMLLEAGASLEIPPIKGMASRAIDLYTRNDLKDQYGFVNKPNFDTLLLLIGYGADLNHYAIAAKGQATNVQEPDSPPREDGKTFKTPFLRLLRSAASSPQYLQLVILLITCGSNYDLHLPTSKTAAEQLVDWININPQHYNNNKFCYGFSKAEFELLRKDWIVINRVIEINRWLTKFSKDSNISEKIAKFMVEMRQSIIDKYLAKIFSPDQYSEIQRDVLIKIIYLAENQEKIKKFANECFKDLIDSGIIIKDFVIEENQAQEIERKLSAEMVSSHFMQYFLYELEKSFVTSKIVDICRHPNIPAALLENPDLIALHFAKIIQVEYIKGTGDLFMKNKEALNSFINTTFKKLFVTYFLKENSGKWEDIFCTLRNFYSIKVREACEEIVSEKTMQPYIQFWNAIYENEKKAKGSKKLNDLPDDILKMTIMGFLKTENSVFVQSKNAKKAAALESNNSPASVSSLIERAQVCELSMDALRHQYVRYIMGERFAKLEKAPKESNKESAENANADKVKPGMQYMVKVFLGDPNQINPMQSAKLELSKLLQNIEIRIASERTSKDKSKL